MEHLALQGVACPTPVKGKDGAALRELCGRPAAIVTFLAGMWPRRIQPLHCAALGGALAALHRAGRSFGMRRINDLSVAGWRQLYECCRSRAAEVQPGLSDELGAELEALEREWPQDLPSGVIHADLFPDNVFFREQRVSGVIDFYFACTDFLAYDLAICLNAWCFEADGSLNVTKARLLLSGYRRSRPLTPAELTALPLLARGSALRFLLTRLFDWLNQPAGALVRPKDPLEYLRKLRFHRGIVDLGATVSMPELSDVEIFTDGACRGNPGPGGWAAILRYRGIEKELSGYAADTTNNRMEMTAAIAGLEALKRPCRVRLYSDSQYLRDGITKWIHGWKRRGWTTADKQPVKNVDLWQRLDTAAAGHTVEWEWVRGHAGHPENERADALARAAITGAR